MTPSPFETFPTIHPIWVSPPSHINVEHISLVMPAHVFRIQLEGKKNCKIIMGMMMADVDCGRALGITDHSADVGAAEAGPVRQTSRIITLLPHHHRHHHHHHHLITSAKVIRFIIIWPRL